MYKILIRPLSIEDSKVSFNWRNDSEVWKYTGNRPNIPITEEIERNWIVSKNNETNSKRFAIEVDDNYVGNVQLTSITKSNAEFHIFIGNRDFWGKGIAYSAIQQLLRYADVVLELDFIYLKVHPEHLKAIKLYERCGFVKKNNGDIMEIYLRDRKKPMVSIFSMVYNHQSYLEQCLDSLLMQKCLFDYEIVIGEDFSDDNSRDIILSYQNKYPGKFKLILHQKNIGAIKNQNSTLLHCQGKYIAICEGDDFWIDPYKIQKQTDFLEANENYTVCGHSVKIWDENKKSFIGTYSTDKIKLTLIDAITGPPLHTSSIFFRRNITDKILMPNLPSGDEALWLAFLKYGKGGNIKENMSVYRLSSAGSWSTKSVNEKNTLTIKLQIWILFNYPKFIKKQIIKLSNIEISEVNISELTIHELIVYKSFKFISICYAKLKMLC